jgi:hypothetical protein
MTTVDASTASLTHDETAPQPSARALMPIEFTNSAEFGWLRNARAREPYVLDDMAQAPAWKFSGPAR